MRSFLVCLIGVLMSASLFARVLTIGTLSYDPPFETIINKKGNFFGFEVELMKAICAHLNEKCRYKPLIFEKIFEEAQAGTIDLAMAGISITPEREQIFLFSLPYLASKAQLLTNSGLSLNSFADVNGKRIGIERGTAFKKLAQKKFKGVSIKEYFTQNDLFQAMANNSVDAIFLDQTSARYWVDNNGGLFKTVGEGIPLGIGYGIMANVSRGALIKRINQALIDIENNGVYLAIYQQYF